MTNDERNPNDEVLLKTSGDSLPVVILVRASSFSSALAAPIRVIRGLI